MCFNLAVEWLFKWEEFLYLGGSCRYAYFISDLLITSGFGWNCILQAEDGVGIPEQILDSSRFQSSARFYFMYNKLKFIWSISYFALLVLNFLEVSNKLLFNFTSSYLYIRLLGKRKMKTKWKRFLISLNTVQKPLWCEKYTSYSCNDREYFFLGQLPYLTGAECLIYEVRTYDT